MNASVNPQEMATDAAGDTLIADAYNNRVVMVRPSGVIEPFAGNGTRGFSGDGGPATSAQLNFPHGVAVDPGGNVLIADSSNRRIRKVSPSGTISTIAGNGTFGFTGDGGPARNAELAFPTSIAVDGAGNLFISDNGSEVRRIDPSGIITTVASGAGSLLADGHGSLYMTRGHVIVRMDPSGAITAVAGTGTQGFSPDGTPAVAANLSYPYLGAVDAAGELLFSDSGNLRIRKIDTSGSLTTVAGNGIQGETGDGGPATGATLDYPDSLVINGGALVIGDQHRLRTVDASGIITTLAGNGFLSFAGDGLQATSAAMWAPTGDAVDAHGNIYVTDSFNDRVRRISPTGMITTIAGSGTLTGGFSGDGGPATSAQLDFPLGVTTDARGDVLVSDANNNRVRKITPAGIITTIAGTGSCAFGGDGGAASKAQLCRPVGLTVDKQGNLFIADAGNARVREINTKGVITTIAGNGKSAFSGDGPATMESIGPWGVATDGLGDVLVTDNANGRLREITSAGAMVTVAGIGWGYAGDGGPAALAEFKNPTAVAIDASRNVYISDTGNDRVRRVTPAGIITTVVGTGQDGFSGDNGPATAAQISEPLGIVFDKAGRLLMVDSGNGRVRAVS